MPADADTITPSAAEIWVAYYKKAIISVVPLLLAGFVVVRDAVQSGQSITWPVGIAALVAAAQVVGVYLPSNARAKLVASLILAIAGGVTAAFNDHFTTASLLVVVTQFLAWAHAGTSENGAHPDVVKGEVVGAGVHSWDEGE